jgi:hypothetical protein
MFDTERFNLLDMGRCVIDPYVEGLRAGCRGAGQA